MFAGADDQQGYLWRVSDGNLMHVLSISLGARRGIMFSRDSALLFVGASHYNETRTDTWQTSDWQRQRSVKLADEGIVLAFSHDGSRALTEAEPGALRVWQLGDGKSLGKLLGHTDVVDSIALSADGVLLAVSTGQQIQIWRLADGVLLQRFITGDYFARDVVFSPDGAHLAARISLSLMGDVLVWRLSDGALVRIIRGKFKVPIYNIAFGAGGSELATMAGEVKM